MNQLQVVAGQAGAAIYAPQPGNGVGDPVQVARDGVEVARRQQHDVVIIDTAGRLGVDAEMMKQAADIRAATDPDEVLFVIDAMIGQDAVNTAKAFQDGVDFTGVVLSKLDGDARGGAALSVASVTGRPIIYASTGEGLDDLEPFHPDRMASRILDLGDILTLIEQAQSAFDEEEAMKMAEKLATDSFTLEDFLDQMQQLKKMGSMKKMLGMLPGMGQMKQQLEDFDEKDLDRTEAIIRSMTPIERRNPKVLNGSRRLRIARGSGMTVTDVNQLVQRFDAGGEDDEDRRPRRHAEHPGHGADPGHASGCIGQARQAAEGEGIAVGQPGQARRRERRDRGIRSRCADRLGLRARRRRRQGRAERGRPRRAAEAARQGLTGRPSRGSVPERGQVLAQRRAGAELADQVVHDLAQVAVRGIRDHRLTRIARALRQDRLEAGELPRALELDGDVCQARHRLAEVLAHRQLAFPRGRR